MSHNTLSMGFTLLEVLVALTILSVTITGAVTLAHQGFMHLERTEQHQQASYYAQNHLIKLDANNELKAGTYSGNYAPHYHWALLLKPLVNENSSTSNAALTAELTVNFPSGQQDFHSLILVHDVSVPNSANNNPSLSSQ